jgi:hypothetical protein
MHFAVCSGAANLMSHLIRITGLIPMTLGSNGFQLQDKSFFPFALRVKRPLFRRKSCETPYSGAANLMSPLIPITGLIPMTLGSNGLQFQDKSFFSFFLLVKRPLFRQRSCETPYSVHKYGPFSRFIMALYSGGVRMPGLEPGSFWWEVPLLGT